MRVANGKTVVAEGRGTVELRVETHTGSPCNIKLHNVLYTPSLANNIFSTNQFVSADATNSVFLNGEAPRLQFKVGDNNYFIPLLSQSNLTYLICLKFSMKSSTFSSHTTRGPSVSLQQLHERLGHIQFRDCVRLARERGISLTRADGVFVEGNDNERFCDVCNTSKQHKKPIADMASRDDVRPGAVLHCDLKGPIDKSHNGHHFALVVVDESTRIVCTRTFAHKDGCVKAMGEILDELASFAGCPIVVGSGSVVHGDSESVLLGSDMKALLTARNITMRASPPYTHERNGIAERAIQTLFNVVRSLLQQSGLSERFWPVALQHATYLRNVLPTAVLGGKSPLQQLTGKAPELKHLRKFGSAAFVKVDDAQRRALDPKARQGIYVGHCMLSDSMRIMFVEGKSVRFMNSVHVNVNESDMPFRPKRAPPTGAQQPPARRATPTPPRSVGVSGGSGRPPVVTTRTTSKAHPCVSAGKSALSTPAPVNTAPAPSHTAPAPSHTAVPTRGQASAPTQPPLAAGKDPLLSDFEDTDDDGDAVVTSAVANTDVPRTYAQAMRSPDRDEWAGAVRAEREVLESMGTFELVPESQARQGGYNVLHSGWVFAKKPLLTGGVKFKGRVVARGNEQREGIDYHEVYAPVVNPVTMRVLLAIAAQRGYDVDQLDVTAAFLNGKLDADEHVYMHIPDGFERVPGHVFKLRRSLYGLRQSPRHWNRVLHEFMMGHGMQQSQVDRCLYYIPGVLYVVCWVDDILIMSADGAAKAAFKAAIAGQFPVRDLGEARSFLGMELTVDKQRHTVTLTSSAKIAAMLDKCCEHGSQVHPDAAQAGHAPCGLRWQQ